jgi:hypothetical protein
MAEIETQKLEESQLLIFVQLLVLPPLVFHVLPDRVFIAVLADRACEIPIRSKLPAPQLLPRSQKRKCAASGGEFNPEAD